MSTPRTLYGISASLASNALNPVSITIIVLSAAAPVTVVAGVIPSGFAATGIIGLPIAFVVIGVILALFSVGYNAMGRRITNAGAFYAYVSQGLGRPLGVAAAVAATLAYTFLQVGLYGIFGTAVAPLLNPLVGVDVTWWGWAFVAWAVIGVLGLQKLKFNVGLLTVLMSLEVLLIIVFTVSNFANPANGEVSLAALSPTQLAVAGIGAGLITVFTGFVGFEGTAVHVEEARQPRARTIRRATIHTIVVIAGLYTLYSLSLTVATGPDQVAEVARRDGGEMIFNLAGAQMGPAWITIGHSLFAFSVFAAMISYHNFFSRYIYALGRENVLPVVFGRTNRNGAPMGGSVFQTAVGFAVIAAYAIAGTENPVLYLFFLAGTTGAFGVLLLLTLTSVAVIRYLHRHRDENIWRAKIAPGLALAALLFITGVAAVSFDSLLGVAPDSPLRWVLPSLYLATTAIGLIWGFVLKASRPEVYDKIGLGVDSATGRATNTDIDAMDDGLPSGTR